VAKNGIQTRDDFVLVYWVVVSVFWSGTIYTSSNIYLLRSWNLPIPQFGIRMGIIGAIYLSGLLLSTLASLCAGLLADLKLVKSISFIFLLT